MVSNLGLRQGLKQLLPSLKRPVQCLHQIVKGDFVVDRRCDGQSLQQHRHFSEP